MTKMQNGKTVGRILGRFPSGKIIRDPHPNTSSMIYGATGSAKTTSVLVPAVQSLLADTALALIINDVKDGEVAAQIGSMCRKYGRKFGVLDDFHVLGADYPYRYSLNPFGAVVSTRKEYPRDQLFANDTACHALIEEPSEPDKNKYFRDTPREEMDLGIRILLDNRPDLATPGGLCAMMGDPHVWKSAVDIAAEEGDAALQSRARQSMDMRDSDPEHYFQHLRAALTALRIYEPGSALHEAGFDTELTHQQIIDEGWVFCLVQPQRHTARLGAHFALHIQSFMHAQMSGKSGRALYLLDELCNAPLKSAVDAVTILRGYRGASLYIAQSRADVERKYGARECTILEDNCPTKQWLSFTNYDDAERVSRAIGEETSINPSVGVSSDKVDFSGNIGLGKERIFSADALMNLPPNEQIIYLRGIGWVHCEKFFQNQAAPYCHDLDANPYEGGRLEPDPLITLPTPGIRRAS
ncbi:type IV secretory system conjugative DNA transfer family protein [Pseudahrensia aquimaris]|uniref:Type IV secretory system conjugative DNA transfer family protein n=1 Tax=Pseudahrensia aquimaris TaxID=744461 RepID=A0ABW3FH54_9HYPH